MKQHKLSLQRSLVQLLAVLLCLTMMACGGDEGSSSTPETSTSTTAGDSTATDGGSAMSQSTTAPEGSNTTQDLTSGTVTGKPTSYTTDTTRVPGSLTTVTTTMPPTPDDNTVENVFDGDPQTYWVAEARNQSVLEHSFGKTVSFNVIRFRESGNKIDNILVEAKGADGQYTTIYRQDEVGVRTGILDETVSATAVRVTVEYGQFPVIEDITFENVSAKRTQSFRTVGYYTTNHEGNRNNWDKLDTMTDLILFGYTAYDVNGDLVWMTDKSKMESELNALKTAMGSRNIDLWFCIGNFAQGTDTSKLFANAAARKKLIDTCVKLTKDYGFVGIDVDYEYPYEQANWDNYSTFLVELKAALKKEGKLLSTAQGPWGVGLSKEAIDAIDYVNIMAYDLDDAKGRHAGYKLIQSSTEYFVKLGFPKSKLVMGLAFYGVSTTDKSDSMSGHPYSTYVQRFRNALKTYTNELGGYYFTGRDMNRDKTFYCIEEGLSGVFAWHFACDIDATDERSLWRAVGETVDRFVK